MTTKKRKAITACAMHLMDAYDGWQNAEWEEEYYNYGAEYGAYLDRLSSYAGIKKESIENALCKHCDEKHNLDWLRDLGVEI